MRQQPLSIQLYGKSFRYNGYLALILEQIIHILEGKWTWELFVLDLGTVVNTNQNIHDVVRANLPYNKEGDRLPASLETSLALSKASSMTFAEQRGSAQAVQAVRNMWEEA